MVNTANTCNTAGMPKPETLPHKRLLQLDSAMKKAIEDFRFRERFKTEAEAIRELIRRGLASKPPKPTR